MEKLITIRTFGNNVESEMVKAYLESAGIQVFIKDELTSRTDVTNINGGIKLEVLENDLESAINTLKEGGYLTDEDLEPSPELKFVDKILSKFRKK